MTDGSITRARVQFEARFVFAVTNRGHNLTVAKLFAHRRNRVKQRQANAAPLPRTIDVNGRLHREFIGGTRVVGTGIGVANHLPLSFRDQPRQPARFDIFDTAPDLLDRWSDPLKRARPVRHMIAVDTRDRRRIGEGRASGLKRIAGGTILSARCHCGILCWWFTALYQIDLETRS